MKALKSEMKDYPTGFHEKVVYVIDGSGDKDSHIHSGND